MPNVKSDHAPNSEIGTVVPLGYGLGQVNFELIELQLYDRLLTVIAACYLHFA